MRWRSQPAALVPSSLLVLTLSAVAAEHTNTLRFAVSPAIRSVHVSGNAAQFREHHWMRDHITAGVTDFLVEEKGTDGRTVRVSGHALTDDYEVLLELRQRDVGFVRVGAEQFRRFYDDHGPYYDFRDYGFSSVTPRIVELGRDLHMDTGKAFAEVGVLLPRWPEVVLGYEYQFKEGEKSIQQWGPVTHRTGGSNVTVNIFPAFKQVDERVHVLRLDAVHEWAGVRFEDNLRAEFWDLETARLSAATFPAGELYPSALTLTRETHEQMLVANALRGEKSVNDWLFLSAGYLFSTFDADASFDQQTQDGAGRPVGGTFWRATEIVLEEDAHVFNANVLGGPWDGFTASLGVQNEWSEQRGFGNPNYREGDPNDPTEGIEDEPGFGRLDLDRFVVEESAAVRYTKIPATVLFADARWKQERSSKYEDLTGHHEFLRDTDQRIDWQEYRAGFDVSPWRWGSLHASYRRRDRAADYDDRRDEQPHGDPGEGYPAFIRSRATKGDALETRLVLKPASWLKASLVYQLALTDYEATTDGVNSGSVNVRGGDVFAGEHDQATYSANLTLTPWRRLYLNGTVSFSESRTWTEVNGSSVVRPYRGDVWNLLGSGTFLVSERTDLNASYSFSRARYGDHNLGGHVPLGMDYNLHSFVLGVAHRFHANLSGTLKYGVFDYAEPTARGFLDYTAHMVFGTLVMRLP
jgi:hypothetical protein